MALQLDREPDQQNLDYFKKIETEDIIETFGTICSRKSNIELAKPSIVDIYKNLFETTLFHMVTNSFLL